jgi:uncharacterized protein
LSITDYQVAEQNLLYDFVYVYSTVDIDEPLVDLAVMLAKRHKLRGYDAIQLAAAITVQTVLSPSDLATLTFLSADEVLLQAAEHESLPIDNPNLHA